MSKRIHAAGRIATGVAAALLAASASAQRSTPVRDVENPARSPLAATGSVDVPVGFTGSFNTSLVTLDADQRYVLEFASVRCTTPSGNAPTTVSLGIVENTAGGGVITRPFEIPLRLQGTTPGGTSTYVGALATRLYADSGLGGVAVRGNVAREESTGSTQCNFNLSGHTIDL